MSKASKCGLLVGSGESPPAVWQGTVLSARRNAGGGAVSQRIASLPTALRRDTFFPEVWRIEALQRKGGLQMCRATPEISAVRDLYCQSCAYLHLHKVHCRYFPRWLQIYPLQRGASLRHHPCLSAGSIWIFVPASDWLVRQNSAIYYLLSRSARKTSAQRRFICVASEARSLMRSRTVKLEQCVRIMFVWLVGIIFSSTEISTFCFYQSARYEYHSFVERPRQRHKPLYCRDVYKRVGFIAILRGWNGQRAPFLYELHRCMCGV